MNQTKNFDMISDKAKSISSSKHIDNSINTGLNGESNFISAANKSGLTCVKSSKKDDIFNHIDFYLNGVAVDVKGYKNSHSLGYVVIEFKNVNGKNGWCSDSSKAELIAFEFMYDFILVRNKELLEFCRRTVENVFIEKFDSADLYKKLYTRNNRKDLMTTIKRLDLTAFRYVIKLKK